MSVSRPRWLPVAVVAALLLGIAIGLCAYRAASGG